MRSRQKIVAAIVTVLLFLPCLSGPGWFVGGPVGVVRGDDAKPAQEVPIALRGFRGEIVGKILEKREGSIVIEIEEVAKSWVNNEGRDFAVVRGKSLVVNVNSEQAARLKEALAGLAVGEQVRIQTHHLGADGYHVAEAVEPTREKAAGEGGDTVAAPGREPGATGDKPRAGTPVAGDGERRGKEKDEIRRKEATGTREGTPKDGGSGQADARKPEGDRSPEKVGRKEEGARSGKARTEEEWKKESAKREGDWKGTGEAREKGEKSEKDEARAREEKRRKEEARKEYEMRRKQAREREEREEAQEREEKRAKKEEARRREEELRRAMAREYEERKEREEARTRESRERRDGDRREETRKHGDGERSEKTRERSGVEHTERVRTSGGKDKPEKIETRRMTIFF
jgi:hypothetical protein